MTVNIYYLTPVFLWVRNAGATYLCGSGQVCCELQSECQPGPSRTVAFASQVLTRTAGLLVLAVGRGRPQFLATCTRVSTGLHECPVTFSRADDVREPGRSPQCLYTMASKVTFCHLYNNHTVEACSVGKRLNKEVNTKR